MESDISFLVCIWALSMKNTYIASKQKPFRLATERQTRTNYRMIMFLLEHNNLQVDDRCQQRNVACFTGVHISANVSI